MKKHKIVYLGLDPTNFTYEGELYHAPIIKIIPRNVEKKIILATHILFTSKVAVDLFFKYFDAKEKILIAVGEATKKVIASFGYDVSIVAKKECQEGIIEELEKIDLSKAKICYPHASKVRPLLTNYFQEKKISYEEMILYDTMINSIEIPEQFDELVFTSSSTVEAFIKLFGSLPRNKKITAIGPITEKTLAKYL